MVSLKGQYLGTDYHYHAFAIGEVANEGAYEVIGDSLDGTVNTPMFGLESLIGFCEGLGYLEDHLFHLLDAVDWLNDRRGEVVAAIESMPPQTAPVNTPTPSRPR